MSGAWQAAVLSLWAVVIVLLVLVLGFLKRILPVIEHAEHLIQTAHHPAPGGLGYGLGLGDDFPELTLSPGLPALVLFTSNDCSRCEALLSEIGSGSEVLGIPLFVQDGKQAPSELRLAGLPVAYAVDSSRKVVGAAAPADLSDLHGLAARLNDLAVSRHG